MKKKKSLLLIISLCFLIVLYAQDNVKRDTLELTLEQCMTYATGDNYALQSIRLNENVQENILEQAKKERLPNLSANVSEGVSHNKTNHTDWDGNYNISSDITLFQGNKINNTIKQNELQHEQARLQTKQYNNELAIQILQSFLAAIGNEELLRVQEFIVKTSERQMEEGKVRWEAGQILESDYLLLESQFASDEDNIIGTRIAVDNSLVALKRLMAIELSQPIKLIYPDDSFLNLILVLPLQSEVIKRSMETLPDIKISSCQVEIAATGLKISQSSYYPTISLSGSVGTGHVQNFNNFGTQLSDRRNYQAGVMLSIPIFNRNKTKANEQNSRIYLEQAELEREQSVMEIEQILINEYGNLVASRSKYKASDIKQNAYLTSFEAYSAMFKAGSITTVDLLQQQNSYINAVNDYIQSKYSFILQRKILDVYMGEPISM